MELQKQLNFLVYWGKLSKEEVMVMPKWIRDYWVDLTIENIKILYGNS